MLGRDLAVYVKENFRALRQGKLPRSMQGELSRLMSGRAPAPYVKERPVWGQRELPRPMLWRAPALAVRERLALYVRERSCALF